MPSKDLCMTCHEEIDREPGRPREATVEWFTEWSSFTKQSEEIRFSHEAHAKTDCRACHAAIPGTRMSMAECVSCHAKDDCATCHEEIRRDRPPPSHVRLWSELHGACSRKADADCSLCHSNDACIACHQTKMPRDHDNFWRVRGHGVAAQIDRERCRTCHQSDACIACHEETSPRSHVGDWGNRHCFGCHVPLRSSESCFVCHRTTPGHDLAPPKPAWHTPSMDCRSCHATTLRHPDNGDDCNACHR